MGGEVYGVSVRILAEGLAMNAGSESRAPARGVTRGRRNSAFNSSALALEERSMGNNLERTPKNKKLDGDQVPMEEPLIRQLVNYAGPGTYHLVPSAPGRNLFCTIAWDLAVPGDGSGPHAKERSTIQPQEIHFKIWGNK